MNNQQKKQYIICKGIQDIKKAIAVGQQSYMRTRGSFERRQNENIRSLFRKIDINSNGLISKDELKLYIETRKAFGKSEDAARSILQQCDQNNDGYIDFAEFRQIVSTVQRKNEPPPSNQELLYAFEQFDTDGNHLICYRQFWKRIKALDPTMSRREADLIFNQIDEDRDGYIDFGEFVRYLDFASP